MPKIGQANDGLTPYQRLAKQWVNCTRCPLCEVRKQVVMYRGKLPCEVLFIGEAPGESEDVLGRPFVGPAGDLLDRMILQAERDSSVHPTQGFANLIGCIPKRAETDDGKPVKMEPNAEEMKACRPRLDGLFALAKPKLIIAVGKLSEVQAKAHEWTKTARVVGIRHPASILRADISQRGLYIQQVIVNLADAFSEFIPF